MQLKQGVFIHSRPLYEKYEELHLHQARREMPQISHFTPVLRRYAI